MNTESSLPNLDQCSSCSNTLVKYESKLLLCLHVICNKCIVEQSTVSGICCNVCNSITNDQLIESLQLSKVKCKTTNCCSEAVEMCTICSEVFCTPCCVKHHTIDNEHCKVYKNLFRPLQCDVHQCPNCINKPAELYCTQCYNIHCGLCHVEYHNGHNHIRLETIYKDNRCAIISANEDLMLNSKYINECVPITESCISKIQENYNTVKSEMKSQWKKFYKKMSCHEVQLYDKLEEHYRKRLTEATKNKLTIQELKIKNGYYTFFTSSILHFNKIFDNARLVEIIKVNQGKNSISKDTPQVLSNVNSDISITNFIQTLDEISRNFKTDDKITSRPILDLSSIIGVEKLIDNIEIEYSSDNLQLGMKNPQFNLEDENIPSSLIITSSVISNEESSMEVIRDTQVDENEKENLQTHTEYEELYKHEVCKQSPSQKAVFNIHNFNKNSKKPYKSKMCNKSFSQNSNLETHKGIVHTSKLLYKCYICKKSYKLNVLKTHVAIFHIGEKPFQCDICKLSFPLKYHLKMHIKTHMAVFNCITKPYKCFTCKKSFSAKSILKTHLVIHSGKRLYKCDICNKSFIQSSHLKTHLFSHTGLKPYKCQICQHSFKMKNSLKDHMFTHTKEKPFSCIICKRSFIRIQELKSHMHTHTGKKPHKCELCDQSFAYSASLKGHMYTHTGDSPYKCEICNKSFLQNCNLKSHMVIHTGEKPFNCTICHTSFSFSSNLKAHIKRYHS